MTRPMTFLEGKRRPRSQVPQKQSLRANQLHAKMTQKTNFATTPNTCLYAGSRLCYIRPSNDKLSSIYQGNQWHPVRWLAATDGKSLHQNLSRST